MGNVSLDEQRQLGLRPPHNPRDLPPYVPAQPPGRVGDRDVVQAYPIMNYEQPATLTEAHLASLETIRKTSTPVERAIGLAIRTALFSLIWLILSVGLLFMLEGEPAIPFLVFCTLTALTFYLLNGQDYKNSAVGLERHKADLAHDLQSQKLDNDHEIRRRLVDAYIRSLGGE